MKEEGGGREWTGEIRCADVFVYTAVKAYTVCSAIFLDRIRL